MFTTGTAEPLFFEGFAHDIVATDFASLPAASASSARTISGPTA